MSAIPTKEVHAAATNPSERGFPTKGAPAPDDQDAWAAPNNPASKTPAEINGQGKTLDGRGAGTSGGRGKEILEQQEESGTGAVGGGESGGPSDVKQKLTGEEWEKQEGEIGQGHVEAPAAATGTQ
jgi:hypothetical protein